MKIKIRKIKKQLKKHIILSRNLSLLSHTGKEMFNYMGGAAV